jgi:ATP-dependent Clp protease protease subunit
MPRKQSKARDALMQMWASSQGKQFWQVKAATNSSKTGELFLYGPIFGSQYWGDEVTPGAIRDELKALGDIDTLNVYINSPGGDGFAGMAIYNILKRHSAKVIVTIDGLAASAASIIAMAGDTVIMPNNATLMIHKAWTVAMGNEDEFRRSAELLAMFDQSQVVTFAAKSGMDEAQIADLLRAETWMTAQEAVDMGFADEIEEGMQVAASIQDGRLTVNDMTVDLALFAQVPKILQTTQAGATKPVKPATTPDDRLRLLSMELELLCGSLPQHPKEVS